MGINLKTGNVDPKEYVSITEHNLKEISKIENEIAVNNLIRALSAASKIDYQICLLDFKSHLMNSIYLFPEYLQFKSKNILLLPRFLISNLFHGIKLKRPKQVDVIIDDWSEGVAPNFYGKELIDKAEKTYKYEIFNFHKFNVMYILDVFRLSFDFIKCMFLANKIIKEHKIDLREYVFAFFSSVLSGLALRRLYNPKLVVSGNQGGFSTIKAKAAGVEIVLIPNGVFGYSVDTSFKYADYFISIGGKHFIDAALKFGSYFKNIYPFGSLRVYNFNQKHLHHNFNIIYDFLWVGCGLDLLSNYSNKGYSIRAEHEAIKLINKYAAREGVKVAYHCRHDDEVEKLKKLGLFSENIEYLPPTFSLKFKGTKSIYHAVMESKVVMSSLSSVCHEAFTLGKKIAFVNLSGNAYLNYPYKEAGVEYDLEAEISFDEFVNEIYYNKNIDPGSYVALNPNYVDDLLAIVDEVISNPRSKLIDVI